MGKILSAYELTHDSWAFGALDRASGPRNPRKTFNFQRSGPQNLGSKRVADPYGGPGPQIASRLSYSLLLIVSCLSRTFVTGQGVRRQVSGVRKTRCSRAKTRL